MGVISEIKAALSMALDFGNNLGRHNTKSVARGASDQTFTFPCLITDTIPVLTASTMVKNLDRVYASWTQIYLSSVGVIDLNYVKNPRQFVANYKSKFKLETGIDLDEEYEFDESVFTVRPTLYLNRDVTKGVLITEGTVTHTLSENYKNSSKYYLEGYDVKDIPVLEAKPGSSEMLNKLIDNRLDEQKKKESELYVKYGKDAGTPVLADRDIKKMNDMQPYVLQLNVLATKGDSGLAKTLSFNVGVKTTLHLANSDKLIENIVYTLRNKNRTFNFIRWTTGEISLLKDIIFHINDINFNISNKSDNTGKYISALKNMKKKHLKITSSGLSKVAPLGTIVISSYEYDVIKTKYGFDLKNLTFANKIMEELFLMCFIIIDDSTRTIDMLIDGSKSGFETYSLETLEREVNSRSSKLSEELTRMLGSN